MDIIKIEEFIYGSEEVYCGISGSVNFKIIRAIEDLFNKDLDVFLLLWDLKTRSLSKCFDSRNLIDFIKNIELFEDHIDPDDSILFGYPKKNDLIFEFKPRSSVGFNDNIW